MITSVANPRVKQVVLWQNKAKERRKDNIFLAEGVKMFEEAPEKSIREVYLTQELADRWRSEEGDLWKRLEMLSFETVSS